MCIVKDELLNHLHDDHPHVEPDYLHHENGILEL